MGRSQLSTNETISVANADRYWFTLELRGWVQCLCSNWLRFRLCLQHVCCCVTPLPVFIRFSPFPEPNTGAPWKARLYVEKRQSMNHEKKWTQRGMWHIVSVLNYLREMNIQAISTSFIMRLCQWYTVAFLTRGWLCTVAFIRRTCSRAHKK